MQMHDLCVVFCDDSIRLSWPETTITRLLKSAGGSPQVRETTEIDPLGTSSLERIYLIPAPTLDHPAWSGLRTRLASSNRCFIIVGDRLDSQGIVRACRDGAFDVLDFRDRPRRWTQALHRAAESQVLWWQLYGGQTAADSTGDLIGRTAPMKALRLAIDRLGPTRASVLILGESGTGKERVAAALHQAGGTGEFVAFNCAAMPAQLLEAELFGVTRGAFTGAQADRPGLVEQADGGTLFLDEIGEMDPAVQSKLLRFLETRTARRLGSNQDYQVELRIVAATNRDLDRGMQTGEFRPDLYYRLAEITLQLAPLRERLEDVPLLARHFLDGAGTRFGKFYDAIEPELIVKLQQHPWPGNVRELKSTIDRLVLMHDGPVLRSGWWEPPAASSAPPSNRLAPTPPSPPPGSPPPLRTRRDRMRRAQELLANDGFGLAEVAAEIGVHPSTLFRWRQSGKV
jgi:DNA-binding NtrC family response regulator